VGVFGGSGFYTFLDVVQEIDVETPYGLPSAPVTIGAVEGRPVAFLPRHGVRHQFPPHVVPYRANVWAMKQLGVERLFAPSASGSLQPHVKPGDFVVCDQIVDRTIGRDGTFYDGPVTIHVSFADPYCPILRAVSISTARGLGIPVHERGTVVVVPGPRFSTRAESASYARQGWDVINMTQMPEAALARELELCYANVSLITDYDVGVEGTIEAVTHDEVLRVFAENLGRLRELLLGTILALPDERDCPCPTALGAARLEA
jgi:5'-methylthioadenosine phosphorylase